MTQVPQSASKDALTSADLLRLGVILFIVGLCASAYHPDRNQLMPIDGTVEKVYVTGCRFKPNDASCIALDLTAEGGSSIEVMQLEEYVQDAPALLALQPGEKVTAWVDRPWENPGRLWGVTKDGHAILDVDDMTRGDLLGRLVVWIVVALGLGLMIAAFARAFLIRLRTGRWEA